MVTEDVLTSPSVVQMSYNALMVTLVMVCAKVVQLITPGVVVVEHAEVYVIKDFVNKKVNDMVLAVYVTDFNPYGNFHIHEQRSI